MRTLIISDIHQKHLRAQKIIDDVPHDEVVLLGDYFDDWNDGPRDLLDTGLWLEGIFDAPEVISLLGNHDVSYLSPLYRCGGWSEEKQKKFDDMFFKGVLQGCRLWYETQGWLISHAGVGRKFAEAARYPELLQFEIHERFWDYLNVGQKHSFGYVSGVSGGRDPYDGPLWHRPQSAWCGDKYLEGRQIFGHTIVKEPSLVGAQGTLVAARLDKPLTGISKDARIALDTNLRHYAVIEDGVLVIHEVK